MDENEKSRRVRDMFGSIAKRYDFLNHFLSANLDRRWREACVREIERRIPSPVPRILDVGCGTGDLSLSFSRLGPVVGCDFCHPMLQLAMRKVREEPQVCSAARGRCPCPSVCRRDVRYSRLRVCVEKPG